MHPRGSVSKARCIDCNAVLSKYRKPREIMCAPCERSRIDRSLKHAHELIADPSRSYEAFAARWRGLEWDTIAGLAEYPSAASAQSAARDYAKRHRLILP